MKAKYFVGKTFEEADKKYGSKVLEETFEQYELNTCDKCTRIELSSDLVWITEDFVPKEGENPSKAFYEYWGGSALCEDCYKEEL